jgi:hypothetical protein
MHETEYGESGEQGGGGGDGSVGTWVLCVCVRVSGNAGTLGSRGETNAAWMAAARAHTAPLSDTARRHAQASARRSIELTRVEVQLHQLIWQPAVLSRVLRDFFLVLRLGPPPSPSQGVTHFARIRSDDTGCLPACQQRQLRDAEQGRAGASEREREGGREGAKGREEGGRRWEGRRAERCWSARNDEARRK